MINTFEKAFSELFKDNENIVLIVPDDDKLYSSSRRYVNVGIAECNAIGMAAGLASCGKIPFVKGGGSFLAHRSNEFIRDDVSMQNRNVKIIATGAGIAINALGNTQHMTEDMSSLRAMPNMVIVTPATPTEVALAVPKIAEINKPVYMRIGRHEGIDVYDHNNLTFEIGKGQMIKEGWDVTIITTGTILSDVLQVIPRLEENNIHVEVINMHTIKPIDEDMIIQSGEKTGKILTIEEHSVIGGLKSAVAEVLADRGSAVKLYGMGLQDCFAKGYGTYKEIKETNGLGQEDIYETVKNIVNKVEEF
ncbi:MAG: transketolase [Lachnospiraceae bacterium]|nr:transketolase [Lachnospiraceae bacterium]